ncbi:YDG domain-containing protein [Lysinibacillus sp. BF-4]|uniref:YDG domain-containing protein n=1 Tax=Lysinibacillus sp. BF-4 TaxID=1473546 RepID=UPI001F367FF0|nr:YDG domain-containing protein [Lysinibacillus sp. BF-4]
MWEDENSGLTIAAPTFNATKVYDGANTVATVAAGELTGVAEGDIVTVNATATYDNADVGNGKTITVSYTLSGADAGKYSAPAPTLLTTGEITAKALTIAVPAVASKEYDGTTTATVTAGALTGVVGSDTVTVSATGTFADANVGAGKTVAVAYTLAGAQAGNYTLANDTATADITAIAIVGAELGLTAPVIGEAPVTSSITGTGYTGTVNWTGTLDGDGKFQSGQVYTATVTLTPATGYTLTGLLENSFTNTSGGTVTNAVDSATVTVTFTTL